MIWNSSPHPISDIRDWSNRGCLELQPPFQRRGVWSNDARIMLMDTIIKRVPMPKIFLATQIREDQTYRIVIDGQQRITAILDFLKNKFCLSAPYKGEHEGKFFKDFNVAERNNFLSYSIDFNEANNPTDEETREVYARVNKYTVALNKQELRRADFPGDFLDVSESISTWPFFEEIKLFTPANRRRFTDVEYISELLAALISGVQEKKETLDTFYRNYAEWDVVHKKSVVNRLKNVAAEINKIFIDDISIEKTRFKQKADFYSLIVVMDRLLTSGQSVEGIDLQALRQDLRILNLDIAPESEYDLLSEYAIKCVSQGNSSSSRRWRIDFLYNILSGTYISHPPSTDNADFYYKYMDDVETQRSQNELYCASPDGEVGCECSICWKHGEHNKQEWVIVWPSDGPFQLTNCSWAHDDCLKQNNKSFSLSRPKDDTSIP